MYKVRVVLSVALTVLLFCTLSTNVSGQQPYLWAADYNFGTVYKHDASGGLILKFETDFFGHPTGIDFDGTDLLIGDSFELYNRIYKYSRQGMQLSYIDLNTVGLERVVTFEKKALAWDGEFLWYSSSARFEVYKIKINNWAATPGSIEIVASFPVPGSSPTGLEWDGESIWLVDNLNKFYQLDPNGAVLSSFSYSQEVSDLAWDGSHLWVHGGGFGGGTFKLDESGNTLSELPIYYWPGSGAAWEGVVPEPPGVPGDYNDDGIVDAADYVLWRNGGPLQNESDTPGTINQADYEFWRSRFAATSGIASAANVPEPLTYLLFLGAFSCLINRRGTRR